jgi:Beta-galactosidase jelly roll domain
MEGSGKIWRIQEVSRALVQFLSLTAGKSYSFIDEHRGVLNAGGLYGERRGWHLPGYPDASWDARDLDQGLPNDEAGVGFFRTEFTLDIPKGLDVRLSFEFEDGVEGQPYRAILFVNGWNMGKRVANLGYYPAS